MIGHEVLAAWTAIGRNGAILARIVTRGECPPLRIDGKRVVSRLRADPGKDFDVRTCELTVPRATRRVELFGHALPQPPLRLHRVAILGDTGCRIKLPLFQRCNDPARWPFPSLARRIASAKPDLVVHVGDYYYRETACLAPGCLGSPHGDTWPTWSADYFTPAEPMFATVPVLAVRGNHESCRRGGAGWARFLSVFPYGACSDREPAYATVVGGLRFFVVDASEARDDRVSRRVLPGLVSDFVRLRNLPHTTTWLVSHPPLWGLGVTFAGGTATLNATLQAAEGNPTTLPVDLALSGHVHLFEALDFADQRPPQIVVGTGGDVLSQVPAQLEGEPIDGTTVARATVWHDFGFALFDLDAKTLEVYQRGGVPAFACSYGRGTIRCAAVRKSQ